MAEILAARLLIARIPAAGIWELQFPAARHLITRNPELQFPAARLLEVQFPAARLLAVEFPVARLLELQFPAARLLELQFPAARLLETRLLAVSLLTAIRRELIYIWYYFEIQLRQIFWYWVLGMLIGSLVSVFAKDRIHGIFAGMRNKKWGLLGIIPACILGIASPLCMYGTIPIAASFRKQGMREDWLAAFMMASILLNPQLIIYSTALGMTALLVRVISCFFCGCAAGLLIFLFYRNKEFFNFEGFEERASRDTHPNLLIRYLLNFWRNVKATGLYFLFGIFLSALFQRYVPQDLMVNVFGGNEAWGIMMAATIGVPLYACGGGTIPLLQQWLWEGMSMGSAAAFMITGPATKITNLGALKIAMGWRRFVLYLLFVMLFSFLTGMLVNLLV